jgi:hypothetical protein
MFIGVFFKDAFQEGFDIVIIWFFFKLKSPAILEINNELL